jgi:hypothetical protein
MRHALKMIMPQRHVILHYNLEFLTVTGHLHI